MIRKLFVILILSLFTTNSFSAGSDSTSSKVKSNYDKAVESIKFAKKYEAKGKLEKAKKRYAKAQKLLLKSNSEKPNKADTLNYLGFAPNLNYENGHPSLKIFQQLFKSVLDIILDIQLLFYLFSYQHST